jgi:hypothetical protein
VPTLNCGATSTQTGKNALTTSCCPLCRATREYAAWLQPCLRGDVQHVSLRPMAWTRCHVSAEMFSMVGRSCRCHRLRCLATAMSPRRRSACVASAHGLDALSCLRGDVQHGGAGAAAATGFAALLQPCLCGDVQHVSLRPMAWTRCHVSAAAAQQPQQQQQQQQPSATVK